MSLMGSYASGIAYAHSLAREDAKALGLALSEEAWSTVEPLRSDVLGWIISVAQARQPAGLRMTGGQLPTLSARKQERAASWWHLPAHQYTPDKLRSLGDAYAAKREGLLRWISINPEELVAKVEEMARRSPAQEAGSAAWEPLASAATLLGWWFDTAMAHHPRPHRLKE